MAQQNQPTTGDFVTLVRKYLDILGISYKEATSTSNLAIKKTHTKVTDIQYLEKKLVVTALQLLLGNMKKLIVSSISK